MIWVSGCMAGVLCILFYRPIGSALFSGWANSVGWATMLIAIGPIILYVGV